MRFLTQTTPPLTTSISTLFSLFPFLSFFLSAFSSPPPTSPMHALSLHPFNSSYTLFGSCNPLAEGNICICTTSPGWDVRYLQPDPGSAINVWLLCQANEPHDQGWCRRRRLYSTLQTTCIETYCIYPCGKLLVEIQHGSCISSMVVMCHTRNFWMVRHVCQEEHKLNGWWITWKE